MINSICKTNYTAPALNNNLRVVSNQSFCAKPSADTVNQPKKKNYKLAWTLGILAAAAVGATAYFPALRMKFTNLFKKQVSEEIINNSIRKHAKEIANLPNEKAVFINPKTGEVVHTIEGIENQVVSNSFKSMLISEATINGHNHPVHVLQVPAVINNKELSLEMRINDSTFSLTDLYNNLVHKVSHAFVATKENVYHIKFNKNHDKDKFLNYLVDNHKIHIKDRQQKTIFDSLRHQTLEEEINLEDVSKSAFKTCKTEEEFKEFVKNGASKYISDNGHSKMQTIADKMGWTYWREPISKA